MNRYTSLTPILLLIIATVACTAKLDEVPERYLPIYEKFRTASAYVIEIPESEIIDIPYANVQAIRSPEGADYDVGLGWRAVATPDSILVVTQRNTIKSIDIATGKLLNEYSFVGNGPGEYQFISNLQVTDELVMIADLNLSIVNIYDRRWNLVDEVLLPDLERLNIDGDIFYLAPHIFYPSATNRDHIINAINLENRSDSSLSFHRRVIPVGWGPIAYNEAMIDASPAGELLLANSVSPFLFLYQGGTLKELYYLDLPDLELLVNAESESTTSTRGYDTGSNTQPIKNPPPIPIKRGQRGISMSHFLVDILHTGDHIIFYYSNWFAKQRFLTVLEKDSNNRWQHQGSYRFLKASGDPFHIGNLSYSGSWLYLSSHFEDEILRIDLNRLIALQSTPDILSVE